MKYLIVAMDCSVLDFAAEHVLSIDIAGTVKNFTIPAGAVEDGPSFAAEAVKQMPELLVQGSFLIVHARMHARDALTWSFQAGGESVNDVFNRIVSDDSMVLSSGSLTHLLAPYQHLKSAGTLIATRQ